MRESELLAHIYARSAGLGDAFAAVVVGPGDDCAVVRAGAAELLLKVDQLVEGRHFEPATPLEAVARKSIARAVSDIAAMGGAPLCALAAATLPRAWLPRADALFDAMAAWARRWGCPLVGGDIATLGEAQDGPLVLSVSLVGVPHPRRGPVRRAGARPGDAVYVTGALGHSLVSGRHLAFEPRLAEAGWLCDTLAQRLHAMMDISDGLGIDAGRLAAAGGVRLELEAAALPIHADTPGPEPWRRALADGEDYELLFAADGPVPGACPLTGTPITRIGRVAAGAGAVIAGPGGTMDITALGWEHR